MIIPTISQTKGLAHQHTNSSGDVDVIMAAANFAGKAMVFT